jgi:hypothetical protein
VKLAVNVANNRHRRRQIEQNWPRRDNITHPTKKKENIRLIQTSRSPGWQSPHGQNFGDHPVDSVLVGDF